MRADIDQFPRNLKADIAQQIVDNLEARAQKGPAEPALDAYIPELADLADRLRTHVDGKRNANAAREKRLGHAAKTDGDVDALYRHIDSYLYVESIHRGSPYADDAGRLHKVACPDGLAHIDDAVPDENAYCRAMLGVLMQPEHQGTLQAIRFPMAWLPALGAALDASDAAHKAVVEARGETSGHVDLGRDAEDDWLDLMIRLRSYINSRARRGETAKKNEGKALLQPLAFAMAKQKAEAAARATRRANSEAKATEASADKAKSPSEAADNAVSTPTA